MKKMFRLFKTVVTAILVFGLFFMMSNSVYAQNSAGTADTSFKNTDPYKTYKYLSDPNDPFAVLLGRSYIPIFVKGSQGNFEYAFCVDFPEPASDPASQYVGAELLTGEIGTKAFSGKLRAIAKIVNAPDGLDRLKTATGVSNLTMYDVLLGAQRAVWMETDNKGRWTYSPGTLFIPGYPEYGYIDEPESYEIVDFLNGRTTSITIDAANAYEVYKYLVDTLPDETDDSTPIAKIADIKVEWNAAATEFTISYKVEGNNADGTPLTVTRNYYEGNSSTPSTALSQLETETTVGNDKYYSITLPAADVSKQITIEITGQQIYTGYFAVIMDGVQDLGGYAKDKTIDFKDRESITIPAQPQPKFGSLKIIKHEAGSETTLLSGAVFEVTYPNGTKQTVTTGANGEATLSDLPYGVYTYSEVTAPTGYVKFEGTRTFEISGEAVVEVKVANTPIPKGNIKIVKHHRDNRAVLLPGATFEVYFVEGATKTLVGTITTDSAGVATLGNLSYGTYELKETVAPAGYYLLAETQSFTIDSTTTLEVFVANTMIFVPTPDPTPTPTPNPEPEPTPDPEPTPEPEPTPDPEPTPEPEPAPDTDTEGDGNTPNPTPTPPSEPTYEDYLKWLEEQSKTPSYESYLEWLEEQSKTGTYEDYLEFIEDKPTTNRPTVPKLPQTNGEQHLYQLFGLLLLMLGVTLITTRKLRRE